MNYIEQLMRIISNGLGKQGVLIQNFHIEFDEKCSFSTPKVLRLMTEFLLLSFSQDVYRFRNAES